jgi:endonuclease/exonuclease/phosphatase family metal-dependent hydrolase
LKAGWVVFLACLLACRPGTTARGEEDAGSHSSADAAVVADAGVPDGSVVDAAVVDAAVVDASMLDAAVVDAHVDDASFPDAAPPDASVPDAWVPDAQVDDASVPDAGGDLGWPLDVSVPAGCPAQSLDTGGTAWTGWGNFQFPSSVTAAVGQASALLFGQVWQDGATNAGGQAAGFEANLLVGPWGTVPTLDARCWEMLPAAYHGDVGNNDEYARTYVPASPGLRALMYRYRRPGGAWLYADLNGSADGLQAAQAGLMMTPETAPRPWVVATLNLRCRKDPDWVGGWPARLPLVVEALARIRPDVVAFQEDCRVTGGPPQSDEIRAALAPLLNRGLDSRWVSTHRAFDTWDEGVSVMTSHPVEGSGVLDLVPSVLGRKALWVDVTLGGQAWRFYSTHLEVDDAMSREAMRAAEAQLILDDRPPGRTSLVMGDFNAGAGEVVHQAFRDQGMVDGWTRANPGNAGLSFPVDNPTSRIDYIYVGAAARSIGGARQLDDHDVATWLSDHRGVAVVLNLPQGP